MRNFHIWRLSETEPLTELEVFEVFALRRPSFENRFGAGMWIEEEVSDMESSLDLGQPQANTRL